MCMEGNMVDLNNRKGFTLIELLITIVIVGILSMIAVPSYRSYIVQARRSDAEQELTKLVSAFENCFSLNNTYTNCVDNNVNPLPDSVSNYYNYQQFISDNGNEYFITVQAKGSQTRDVQACQTLTINSLGRKFSNCSTSYCRGQSADSNHCW